MVKYKALLGEKFDINKVTVVGNPTITSDGVASGFSGSNYIRVPYRALGQNFKIFTPKFNSSNVSQQQKIVRYSDGNIRIEIYNSKIRLFRYTANNVYDLPVGKTTLQNNTDYYYYVEQTTDDTNYYLKGYISTDNKNWTLDIDKTYTSAMYDYQNNAPIQISGADATQPFIGTLGLTQFKIYIDGQLVFQPVKPTYLLERRKPKVWNKGQFTVVGSPVISDSGWASGFSGANAVISNYYMDFTKTNWEILTPKFSISAFSQNNPIISNYDSSTEDFLIFVRTNGKISWQLATSKGGTNIFKKDTPIALQTNTNYQLKITFDDNKYKLYLATENGTFVEIDSVNTTTISTLKDCRLSIGRSISQGAVYMTVDLKQFKIYTDDNLVFDGGAETYVYDPSKFTVVGSPTITEDGVASGFSASNYVNTSNVIDFSKNWEVKIKIKTGESIDAQAIAVLSDNTSSTGDYIVITGLKSVSLRLSGSLQGFVNLDIGSLLPLTEYFIIAGKNNNTYYIKVVKIDDNTISQNTQINENNLASSKIRIGSNDPWFFKGSIDLTQFSITVDGKEVFTGAKENYYMLNGI